MAQVVTRNIIVGAGNLYISRTDNSQVLLPAAPAAGTSYNQALTYDLTIDPAETPPTTPNPDWRHVGATQEGVEIAYTPDYGEVEVDQLKDAAILFNQGVTITMNTNLAEATLENLLVAWGVPSASLSAGTFSIGVPSEEPIERTAAVVGRAPATADGDRKERVYYARRVISIEGSTHAMRRSEATVFPVSFRLLPNPEFPGAEYGTIVDREV